LHAIFALDEHGNTSSGEIKAFPKGSAPNRLSKIVWTKGPYDKRAQPQKGLAKKGHGDKRTHRLKKSTYRVSGLFVKSRHTSTIDRRLIGFYTFHFS
jgi:hypothetical protein